MDGYLKTIEDEYHCVCVCPTHSNKRKIVFDEVICFLKRKIYWNQQTCTYTRQRVDRHNVMQWTEWEHRDMKQDSREMDSVSVCLI